MPMDREADPPKITKRTGILESASPRTRLWILIAINQLAFPGMGTVMAKRKVGYIQAALMLAGFTLITGYFCWLMYCVFRLFQTGDDVAWESNYRQYFWSWQWGLMLCGAAWLWALISSFQMFKSAKSSDAPSH